MGTWMEGSQSSRGKETSGMRVLPLSKVFHMLGVILRQQAKHCTTGPPGPKNRTVLYMKTLQLKFNIPMWSVTNKALTDNNEQNNLFPHKFSQISYIVIEQ